MVRTEAIIRALFAGIFIYMMSIGGTFPGMLTAELTAITLPVLVAGVIAWLLVHWWKGWTWYRTPLDPLMLAWTAVIALSLIANPLDTRRILIGVWYVLMYMGLWFVLTDVIANLEARDTQVFTTRTALLDALLVGMAFVMAVAYWQVWLYRTEIQNGIFGLIRPSGTLGNPNLLATLTIVAMGISGGRFLGIQGRFWRAVMALYFLISFALLLLTASRGGWIGGAAAGATIGLLWLLLQGMLSPARLRSWYAAQSGRTRLLLGGGALLTFGLLVVMGLVILLSFEQPGRSAELRTYIWETALTMFGEKPFTGHGLFTFGKGLLRLNSMPPLTPHTQAHNWLLNIMAELGIPGIVIMLVSIGLILWLARKNWLALAARKQMREITSFMAAFSALIGFAVHHLFDVTAMMAAFAITGLLLVMIAALPLQPVPMASRWRRLGHPIAIGGLWVALFITGFWGNSTNRFYLKLIHEGLASGDYGLAAQNLQAVIDLDPNMPVYHWQQGYFYGAAAYLTTDESDISRFALAGIDAFDRVNVTEPQVAGTWANRAGLLWQLERTDDALDSWQRAALTAPASWPLWMTYARHAELAGEDDRALDAYTALIAAVDVDSKGDDEGVFLHPVLQGSPLFQTLTPPPPTGLPAVVSAWIMDDDPDPAIAQWEADPDNTARGLVVRALLADADGDSDGAMTWLTMADARDTIPGEGLWISYGRHTLEGGSPEDFSEQMSQNMLRPDYINGVNWWGGTFMRAATPRSFLPQAEYEWLDPLMVALLGESPNIE